MGRERTRTARSDRLHTHWLDVSTTEDTDRLDSLHLILWLLAELPVVCQYQPLGLTALLTQS